MHETDLTQDDFVAMVAGDLRNAPDWPAGRRLLITLTEHGWRLGYQAPEYDESGWDLMSGPDTWATHAWYPDNDQRPAAWSSLLDAAAAAIDAYQRITRFADKPRLAIVLDPPALPD